MQHCAWCNSTSLAPLSDHAVCYACGRQTYANGVKVPERQIEEETDVKAKQPPKPAKKKPAKKKTGAKKVRAY